MGVATAKNIALTCDICGQKFGKTQSLAIHRRKLHRIATIPRRLHKPLNKRMKVLSVPVKLVKRKIIKPILAKSTSLAMSPPKLRMNVASRSVSEKSPTEKNVTLMRKTVFKCPKCIKIFNVYFSANKHIQKNHCVDANGQPVEPNSSQLIKPIRVDPCEICQKPKLEGHICNTSTIMCLGCQETFDNLDLFDQHVKKLHANVESLFFPSNSEYIAWKTELEVSTKFKFTLRNSDTKTEQLYQIFNCSHQSSLEMNKTLLCPSYLHITEFKNGNLVFYYKEHFGHSCTEFSMIKYKKYCISAYLNDFDIKNMDTEKNVYDLFKVITNNVINNSVDLSVSVINTLLNKVLDMAIILNNNGHDTEQIAVKKNMTDDQITEVLAEVRTYPSRRKPDAIIKKNTPENNENVKGSSPNIPNTGETSQLNRVLLQSPPSFNDTYKDFVDQTIGKQKLETTLPTPRRNSVKKKIVMKTKIGQYKPSISPKETTLVPLPKMSPKRRQPSPTTPVLPSKKPKPAVLTKITGKASISPQVTKETRKTPQVNKTPAKTPLKPSINPKTSKETPLPSKKNNTTPIKIKPDIKYEVKEQENDCNILILKI